MEKGQFIMLKKVIYIMKKQGIKSLFRKIKLRWLPHSIKWKWRKVQQSNDFLGIKQGEELRLVVSLTSFPARINTVHLTIQSLLLQSLKPNVVVLWLNPEQFPNGEKDLPQSLLELKRYGLTISWYHNVRSYTKLIPALKEYPDSVIVTADDDIYYYSDWLKALYDSYLEKPDMVHCHRITKFYFQNGKYKIKVGGFDTYNQPSFLHKITGVGGALYPPHILHKDVTDEDKFKKLAPTNDDIWFWFMAVLNKKKINVVRHNTPELVYVGDTQEGECLNNINDKGENLFWKDFYRMLDAYPNVNEIFKTEYQRMGNV